MRLYGASITIQDEDHPGYGMTGEIISYRLTLDGDFIIAARFGNQVCTARHDQFIFTEKEIDERE